jgi:hypothetical protein
MVAIEQGTIIIPALLLDPEDGLAAILSRRQQRIKSEAGGNSSQLFIVCVLRSRRFTPVSTCATVTAVPDNIRSMRVTAPLAARSCKVRFAYTVPEAPEIAKVSSIQLNVSRPAFNLKVLRRREPAASLPRRMHELDLS